MWYHPKCSPSLLVLLRSLLKINISFWLLLLCCLWINSGHAQSKEKEKLEILRTYIRDIQAELIKSQQKKDVLLLDLQKIEQAIGKTTRQLIQLKKRLVNKRDHLQILEAKYSRLRHNRSHQREILAQQIRRAYMTTSHQKTFKWLLSQEDLSSLGRSLVYFNYFHRSKKQRIRQISQALNAITELQRAIHKEQKQLAQLHLQIARKQEKLQAEYQTRRETLAQHERKIEEKNAQLQALREDAQVLEQIVSSLHKLLLDIPNDALNTKPFKKLRGKLLWPCQGRVIQHFGTPHAPGKYRSQGIMITAEQGDPVRAVFYGRVAFADWLRGYGLLLIIDHGDGYMTLYGHNQSLFKEVGDWVETGEIIARAGNSGGHHQIGVYFELRQQGKPTNPLSWLMKPS